MIRTRRLGTCMAMLLTMGSIGVTPSIAADYKIDTSGAHASINFKISHLGYSFIIGRFDQFSGSFTYDEDNPAASSVQVDIDTSSVNTNHGARDNHIRKEDFLHVDLHPKASFVSTSAEVKGDDALTIKGDLSLRGVTKPIVLDVKRIGGGDDPWGNYRQGFIGTTTITMKDFGIPTNLGPSAEEVELTLVVEGVRQ